MMDITALILSNYVSTVSNAGLANGALKHGFENPYGAVLQLAGESQNCIQILDYLKIFRCDSISTFDHVCQSGSLYQI